MDELQIFGQPLDEDAIRQLYLDAATLLRLPLDEAPGATAFEDVSGAHVPASCSGERVPPSRGPPAGSTGRPSSPTHRVTGSAISLGHSAANELANPSPWRPGSSRARSPACRTSSQPRSTKTDNGWSFRLSSGNLAFEPYGYGTSSTSQLGLPAGRWYHVAAVVDADYGVTFYVNGAWWRRWAHSGTTAASRTRTTSCWSAPATAAEPLDP